MNNLDLIEQLEDLKYHCQDFAEDEMEKEIQPFTDDVKALDQAINELRWIPVEEKLPSESDFYLVSYYDEVAEKYLTTMSFYEADIKIFRYFNDCVAWKPLPKPYEKK